MQCCILAVSVWCGSGNSPITSKELYSTFYTFWCGSSKVKWCGFGSATTPRENWLTLRKLLPVDCRVEFCSLIPGLIGQNIFQKGLPEIINPLWTLQYQELFLNGTVARDFRPSVYHGLSPFRKWPRIRRENIRISAWSMTPLKPFQHGHWPRWNWF
jgi:hypothetical protein